MKRILSPLLSLAIILLSADPALFAQTVRVQAVPQAIAGFGLRLSAPAMPAGADLRLSGDGGRLDVPSLSSLMKAPAAQGASISAAVSRPAGAQAAKAVAPAPVAPAAVTAAPSSEEGKSRTDVEMLREIDGKLSDSTRYPEHSDARALLGLLRERYDGAKGGSASAAAVEGAESSARSALAPSGGAPRRGLSEPPAPKRGIGERLNSGWTAFKGRLAQTSIEVVIGDVVVSVLGGAVGNAFETTRTHQIPLAFSEMSQVERDASREGRELGPMTGYLTATNDAAMKVFEAWNLTHSEHHMGSQAHNFAAELDIKQDYKIHRHELPDLLKDLPARAQQARDLLKPLDDTARDMAPVNDQFRRSWDESHTDHYRTETRTRTVDDGNGKSHTETYTEEVYDHTHHEYDYHRQNGEAASQGLDGALAKRQSIPNPEQLRTASQTNADGEYAAEVSRKGEARPQAEQLKAISESWATGATITQNIGRIQQLWGTLRGDAGAWRTQKATAHDDSYNTGSRSDSGPREYQTAQTALSHGTQLSGNIQEVLGGVDYAKANAPVLQAKIRQLIDIELNGAGKGDTSKLTREIMDISRAMYTQNFKGGVDVKEYRTLVVLAWILLGAVLGGLLGAAADRLGNRFGWYRPRRGGM